MAVTKVVPPERFPGETWAKENGYTSLLIGHGACGAKFVNEIGMVFEVSVDAHGARQARFFYVWKMLTVSSPWMSWPHPKPKNFTLPLLAAIQRLGDE
jgi:hypothetical protein